MDSNLTENSVLESTLHDRERREERGIEKVTLQEARRYGMKEKQNNSSSVVKYYYAGHVFVYNERTNKAITSYKYDSIKDLYQNRNGENSDPRPRNKNGSPRKPKPIKAGTRFTKPILVEKSKDHTTVGVLGSHEMVTSYVQDQPSLWTSHTVMVIDMSGSMREDDVNGARCRSDGVWTTLARNFCRTQLEEQSSCLYDIVSVIAMRERAEVVIECEPLTWVLYNKLVDYREWENLKPRGHGFYQPALEKAEELFNMNNHGSCALSLMFFSDGKPSDCVKDNGKFDVKKYTQVQKDLVKTMGNLASKFGRRLNVTCIGMADTDDKFAVLRNMTEEAKQFGAQASFHQPSLNTDSLSQIISSSVASSLSSKTELTSLKTGTARSVRTDVQRERQDAPDDQKPTSQWRVFKDGSDRSVVTVWTWSDTQHDFATIIDPRCQQCFKPVANSKYKVLDKGTAGKMCPSCKACFFCSRCVTVGVMNQHRIFECSDFLKDRREGFLVGNNVCPLSFNVAWKEKAFGEGAERLAYKFRFVDSKGKKFIGPIMVAKESRFVEDLEGSADTYLRSQKHSYHKSFMRTQSIASSFATLFNEKVNSKVQSEQLKYIPLIKFVKPLIFELEDRAAGSTYNVLVEPLIEGKYRKFSNNHGDLAQDLKRDFFRENQGVDVVSAAILLGRAVPTRAKSDMTTMKPDPTRSAGLGLGIIDEGEEEEEDEGSDDEESDDDVEIPFCTNTRFDAASVPDTDYLQAFSHFSFERSGGKFMVVDLQGTFQERKDNQNRSTFILTDPAIHQRDRDRRTRKQFGRTDLGSKGIKAFFSSHECNDVCRLLNLRNRMQ